MASADRKRAGVRGRRSRPRSKPPEGLVKISKLAELSGVPASTIKHYVNVGLLPPPVTRPNRQMAYYDPGLVDRIKAIKILQSERYLPLPTIKKILGEPPKPGEQRAEALRARELAALEPALRPPPSGWLARREILASFQVSEKELELLARAGLLEERPGPAGADAGPGYADTDLELLRVIHETRAAGLGALFPMDVLAPYVQAIRGLVKLELDLFRHRVRSGAAMPPGQSLDEVAHLAQQLGERLVLALRRKLVLSELRALQAGEAGERVAPGQRAPNRSRRR